MHWVSLKDSGSIEDPEGKRKRDNQTHQQGKEE